VEAPFLPPVFQPDDSRIDELTEFLRANPASVGLEGEAVGVSHRIESGHGLLLSVIAASCLQEHINCFVLRR
jgi:hypothetical protein